MEGLAEDRIRAKESHALKGRGKLEEGSQPKTILAVLLHRLGNELGNGVCIGDY